MTTTRETRISVGRSRQRNLSLNTFLRGLCLCPASLCGFASTLLELLLVLNRVYLLMFRAGHSAESESERAKMNERGVCGGKKQKTEKRCQQGRNQCVSGTKFCRPEKIY